MGKEDQSGPIRLPVFLQKGRGRLRHHQRVEMAQQSGAALQAAEPVERYHVAEQRLDQSTPDMGADRPEGRHGTGGIEKCAHRLGLPVAGGDDFDSGGRSLPLQRGNDWRDMGDLMQLVMIEQEADPPGIAR